MAAAAATPEALAAALREANAATAAARAAAAAAEAVTERAEELIRQLQTQGASPPRSAPGRARSSLSLGEMRPMTSDALPRARSLPRRIFILRHGESEGNVDETLYSRVADPEIQLTSRGVEQAEKAGRAIREICEANGGAYRLFFYFSPYARTKQTCAALMSQFEPSRVCGVREEPQLREQDFGNYQDVSGLAREKAERASYGRFFYRFPNGESGADVYDRLTVFEDHIVRDIDAGRFTEDTVIVIVTHGLSLRIFLMRWCHWSVADYEEVHNPPNCAPLQLERVAVGAPAGAAEELAEAAGPCPLTHTKCHYRLTADSLALLKTSDPALRGVLDPQDAWERTLRRTLHARGSGTS